MAGIGFSNVVFIKTEVFITLEQNLNKYASIKVKRVGSTFKKVCVVTKCMSICTTINEMIKCNVGSTDGDTIPRGIASARV